MSLSSCFDGASRIASHKSRQIDKQIREQQREDEHRTSVLLLGLPGSGKRTLIKQMKIIHLAGFTDDERSYFKHVIFHNILHCMSILIEEANHQDMVFDDIESVSLIQSICLTPIYDIPFTESISRAVESLWAEQSIKEIFEHSRELQCKESTSHLLDHCQEYSQSDFIPSNSDILLARAENTAITEVNFMVNKNWVKFIDIGGQQERKKWIHCFDKVTHMIYCVDANNFKEASKGCTNALQEALEVFDNTINNCTFCDTLISLFFTKTDLFKETIKTVDLNVCFTAYDGGMHYENASRYIQRQFLGRNKNKNRRIFSHWPTATDTINVRIILRSMESVIFGSFMV